MLDFCFISFDLCFCVLLLCVLCINGSRDVMAMMSSVVGGLEIVITKILTRAFDVDLGTVSKKRDCRLRKLRGGVQHWSTDTVPIFSVQSTLKVTSSLCAPDGSALILERFRSLQQNSKVASTRRYMYCMRWLDPGTCMRLIDGCRHRNTLATLRNAEALAWHPRPCMMYSEQLVFSEASKLESPAVLYCTR